MALSPAQLQRLRKAAQKTYNGSNQSAEVLARIGEEEGVPVITRLGGLAEAAGGLALTTGSIATILTSGGAAALLGGGVGVVAGVTQTVQGIDILMGKVDSIQAGTTQIIESTGEGGSSECQFKQAPRTQLDEVHGDLLNIGGGITGTGDAARAAAGYLGSFLISLTPEASNHPNIKATAHQILQQAEAANTQASAGNAGIIDHREEFDTFNSGLNDRLEAATEAIAPLLRLFFQHFGHYSLDLAGLAAYQTDLDNGLIQGSGLVVLHEVDGEWVPVLNPTLLTYGDVDNDVFNLLEVVIDVLNTARFRPMLH
jgi:hypothetical protein